MSFSYSEIEINIAFKWQDEIECASPYALPKHI